MSSGKNPLMLMMALAMPGAASALGLGEIHVDSALDEHLAAEIDIVGATALELADLKAAVATRETFQHYGADRPAFLSSTTFKVTQDSQGRPVLAVRSSESFTEPLVNFLVELRWRNGAVIRQYTLLLDPAGITSRAPAVIAADAPGTPAATAASIAPVTPLASAASDAPNDAPNDPPAVRKTTHIKVSAKATLRGVAWRVGERSESDLQRMMIAIFRANPNAFDGNINRLHRGAVLTIPARTVLASISKAEAKREITAQMAAWRAPGRAVAASAAAPAAIPAVPGVPATALDDRVQSLEQELTEMKGLLKNEHDQLLGLQQQALHAEQHSVVVEAPPTANAQQSKVQSDYAIAAGAGASVPILAGAGMLAAALAGLYFWFRRRAAALNDSLVGADMHADTDGADRNADFIRDEARVDAHAPVQDPAQEAAQDPAHDAPAQFVRDPVPVDAWYPPAHVDDSTQPLLPMVTAIAAAGRNEISASMASRAAPTDATVNMRVNGIRLDYNLTDLDQTSQHVQMPSVLNEHAVVRERRTNLADVLKMAIEREPDRHDLHMKLLELYYSVAATNRQAFLEVVQNLAQQRNFLTPDQWDKIAHMGRQIASENPMFAEQATINDDLADCA